MNFSVFSFIFLLVRIGYVILSFLQTLPQLISDIDWSETPNLEPISILVKLDVFNNVIISSTSVRDFNFVQ